MSVTTGRFATYNGVATMISEFEQLAASRGGDTAAFAALVERYQGLVWSVAYGYTGDDALSEDIAQETFLTAWRKLEQVDGADKLRAFFCGIARNLARNARRKQWRATSLVGAGAEARPAPAPTPLELSLVAEDERLVRQALTTLDEPAREAIILFYRDGQSMAELAAALGVTEAAARKRLSRARSTLRAGVERFMEGRVRAATRRGAVAAAVAALLVAGRSPAAIAAPTVAAARTGTGRTLGLSAAGAAVVAAAVLAAVMIARAGDGLASAARSSATSTSTSTATAASEHETSVDDAASAPVTPPALPEAEPPPTDPARPPRLWSNQPLITGRLKSSNPAADIDGDGAFSEDEIAALREVTDDQVVELLARALEQDLTVICTALWVDARGIHEGNEMYDLAEVRERIAGWRADRMDLELREMLATIVAEREQPARVCAPLDIVPAVTADYETRMRQWMALALGVVVTDATPAGAFILEVVPATPARDTLSVGTRIISVDGAAIEGAEDLLASLADKRRVHLEVVELEGARREVTVSLGRSWNDG